MICTNCNLSACFCPSNISSDCHYLVMPVIRLNKVHLPVMLTELKTNQTIIFKSPQVTIQFLFIQIVLMNALLLVIPWGPPISECACSVRKWLIWAASSEFGTYSLCEQRRFRRACASAQSRQNLRCSLIQAVSQEEPSDRKPDP